MKSEVSWLNRWKSLVHILCGRHNAQNVDMSCLGRQAFFSAFIGMNGAHLLTLQPELPSTFKSPVWGRNAKQIYSLGSVTVGYAQV